MAAKKKDLSLVVWVFGWLLSLVTTLKKLAAQKGVPFEAFERLASEKGEQTLAKIVALVHADWQAEQPKPVERQSQGGHPYCDALTNGNMLPENHYCVRVTYAPMPSMDDLKKEWGKDNVSAIFDGRSFSLHASCVGMDRTPGEKVFYVHHAGGNWKSEERIAWGQMQRSTIAPNGYRLATHEEAYEFTKAHPELTDFVGLGSSTLLDGVRCVADVWGLDGRRVLGHSRDASRWDSGNRVLFVRR